MSFSSNLRKGQEYESLPRIIEKSPVEIAEYLKTRNIPEVTLVQSLLFGWLYWAFQNHSPKAAKRGREAIFWLFALGVATFVFLLSLSGVGQTINLLISIPLGCLAASVYFYVQIQKDKDVVMGDKAAKKFLSDHLENELRNEQATILDAIALIEVRLGNTEPKIADLHDILAVEEVGAYNLGHYANHKAKKVRDNYPDYLSEDNDRLEEARNKVDALYEAVQDCYDVLFERIEKFRPEDGRCTSDDGGSDGDVSESP